MVIEKSLWVQIKEKICDDYCKMVDICETQERLDKQCEDCPLTLAEHPMGYNPEQE